MNREEILAAIEQCKRAVSEGYSAFRRDVAGGYGALADNDLKTVHKAQKELARLRSMLDSLPSPTVPEDGVPSTEPATLLYAEDRPWWKRALGIL